tara:strand:- start:44800 stop:46854 length:2055 start_codon:yes stop_codon:yes gene_type:complete
MTNTSLTNKIVGLISVSILLLGFVFIILFTRNEAKSLEESTKQKIQILAEMEVAKIAVDFHLIIDKARSQATYFENLVETNQANRKAASNMIRKIVLHDSLLFSASVVFEKNNFDAKDTKYVNTFEYGETGRFTAWWYGFGDSLTSQPLPIFEKEDWYINIAKEKGSSLLDPYVYPLKNGEPQLFLTAGYPIVVGDKLLGVTASDMSMEHIQKTIAGVSVFDGDYACLISPGGIYAAHPIKGKIGKPIEFERLNENIKEAFSKKETIHDKHISDYINKEVFDFYIPLKINNINKSWYLRVSVPTEILRLQITRLRNNLVLSLLGIVLLILIILYFIIDYAIRPVSKITHLITQLSSIGINGAISIKVKTKDEIGQLGISYNKLLDSLTEKRRDEIELEKHRTHLELLVKDRTEEYMAINEELNSMNVEFHLSNKKLNLQKEELEASLRKLKETQSQLLQAEKMASLGVLTAGVAHEINNPLNYILGSYVGLNNYFKANKAPEKEIQFLLSSLKIGVDRAADIVKGLNQFSRNSEDYNEDCDVHTIINNCLLMLNNQLKGRIEIDKKFCLETIFVTGNMGKLHQVYLNILTNAMQAIENEGTISIKSERIGKNVVIEIIDSGCGISKENLSKVMDPFFTTKEPGKGTGLGLSITFSIVEEHKGKLELESEQNKGTKVISTLPLKN